MARTRILATLGPASSSEAEIRGLAEAGAGAFRVNFSHGDDGQHLALISAVRRVGRRLGRPLLVVADLQGPKTRLGRLTPDVRQLPVGERVELMEGEGPTSSPALPVALRGLLDGAVRGQPILLGDGIVELKVTAARERRGAVEAVVVRGGTVTSHQGIYLPGARRSPDPLTSKDLKDLRTAVGAGVDWIALSFVRSASDLELARRKISAASRGSTSPLLMAKIERAEAVEKRGEILEAADAIMVARGDLGIELPLARLPLVQKVLVAEARAVAKPCVVATQMLLSMVHAARPTRAEATDAANAILDGADCLMLSEETAVGEAPRACVRVLREIAEATEPAFPTRGAPPLAPPPGTPSEEEVVAEAAVRLATGLGAKGLVVPTHSGRTARLVARHRPSMPVLALSSRRATVAATGLLWGVEFHPVRGHLPLDRLTREAARIARVALGLHRGDRLVLTAGYPVEGRPTNLLTVVEV